MNYLVNYLVIIIMLLDTKQFSRAPMVSFLCKTTIQSFNIFPEMFSENKDQKQHLSHFSKPFFKQFSSENVCVRS